MKNKLLFIAVGILLGITILPTTQAQPVSFVVRLGDGTNLASVTASGALKIDGSAAGASSVNTEGSATSYRCAGLVTPAATPTDVITITGSGTKTVKITRVAITVESTAAGIADVVLLRRSAVDTTGTSTTPAIAKLDTADAAATAVCTVYTANPGGLGTLVANIGAGKQSGTQGHPLDWSFGVRNAKALYLRGVTDILAVNGNSDALLTGETWAYDIEWTEQ